MSPPERPLNSNFLRMLANGRTWNIALRTVHIAAMGFLLGGHAFEVPPQRLLVSLGACIASGIALGISEVGPSLLWFHQGRGLMTLCKLVLICSVPFLWDVRLLILLGVVAIGSVGSHMPGRLRYYSVIYREVIPCGKGPGASQLAAELAAEQARPQESIRLND